MPQLAEKESDGIYIQSRCESEFEEALQWSVRSDGLKHFEGSPPFNDEQAVPQVGAMQEETGD